MFGFGHRLQSSVLGGGFVGPLDDYTSGLRIALDIRRRLLASYMGNAFLARADRSGQPTQAIGFNPDGTWDTAALLDFAGSDSVYVVTWYDQSGNGFDFTQASAAAQPRIVNAGVLDSNGMLFSGAQTIGISLDASDWTAGSGTTAQVLSGLRVSTGGGGGYWSWDTNQSGCYVNAFGGVYSDVPETDARVFVSSFAENTSIVFSQERSGSTAAVRVNGSATSRSDATGSVVGTAKTLVVGTRQGNSINGGAVSFFCIWDNTTDAAGRAAALA